jgi:hypothetical protein
MPVFVYALLVLQLAFAASQPIDHPFYGPDFSLSIPNARPGMVQGGSTSFNIVIQSGEAATFKVKVEGIPRSVTAQIPSVGPGLSTITLSCPPNTPTGTYAIQVTAAAGQNQQTQTFALDITPLHPTP